MAYTFPGSKIKYECRECGKELKSFPYASYYREVGYCESCIPTEIRKAMFGNKHKNTSPKKKTRHSSGFTQCKGMTKKSGFKKRCKNEAKSGSYCKYHKNQAKKNKTWTSYHGYIGSNAWRKKALECKHSRFWVCALCGGTAYAAHHNSYKRLGEEMAHDLTPLCKDCHDMFHEHHDYNSNKHRWERTRTP